MQYLDNYAENVYNGYAVRDWLISNVDYAAYAAGLYLALVFKGPDLIAKYIYKGQPPSSQKPFLLRWSWVLWNLLLSVFSFYGTANVTPVLLAHIKQDGLRHALCTLDKTQFYEGPTGMALGLYALSKGPEFIDTLFILLSGKKNLPFLQWFHHVTTFLFAWHAYALGSSAFHFAAALNYTVHTIMYFYFAMAEAGYKSLVKPFAMYITLLQIAQMVVGTFLTCKLVYHKTAVHFGSETASCDGTPWDVARVQLFIVVVNFFMFTHMFVEAYIFPSKNRNNGSAAAAVKGSKKA